MDYEHNDNQGTPNHQGYGPDDASNNTQGQKKVVYVEKPRKSSGWNIFLRIVLILSVIANIFMFLLLVAFSATAFFGSGQNDFYVEKVLKKGNKSNKVVVISIQGVINGQTGVDVSRQIQTARSDEKVKAIIIRTNTPGGGVAPSDQINHQITKFRKETGKPVIAFMQSVAASGGYYTSVACDQIIAEPTVITGSIGVIMQVLSLQELFEDKLGVNPVTIKSGEKKDWPNMFKDITQEQKDYLEKKVITPAYERFVHLVDQGRTGLNESQVRELADGSIYGAQEAFDKNLIDQVGYFEDVISTINTLTGKNNLHVVEYSKPFTLANFLGAETTFGLKIDTELIDKATTPRLQYLWQPGK